jgi:hypothetical protein
MAGFEVSTYGRIWASTEVKVAPKGSSVCRRLDSRKVGG